jgi:hypothetical protein
MSFAMAIIAAIGAPPQVRMSRSECHPPELEA